MMPRWIFALLAAVSVGVLAGPTDVAAHRSHGTAKPAAESAADEPLPFDVGGPFALVDQHGEPRTRDDFRGRYVIVYFGYTACPNTCGIALATIAGVLDDLGEGAAVDGVMITVDPDYDTPERLADFLGRIHPRLIGLTGPPDEIARVRTTYRISARRLAASGAAERLYNHSPIAYLMGPEGDILTLFPPVLPVDRMAEIVRKYLR